VLDRASPEPRGRPAGQPQLNDEELMLIDLRDVLYEGSWDDFRRDLEARRESRPYVFEIVPTSPELRQTIERHLQVIAALEAWERANGRRLRGLS
jgi:hypothetical protein